MKNGQRNRRQLVEKEFSDQSLFQGHQTELNQSVPFIFRARLYPYGTKNGDAIMVGAISEFKLSNPLIFLDQTFDTIWIHRNGIVSMAPDFDPSIIPKSLPIINNGPPLIAVFWSNEWNAQRRRVLIRETNEETILAMAQNEVNIQFRYGKEFEPKSIIIITWMDTSAADEDEENELSDADVLFQLALIVGNNACFAHNIFSKLPKSVKAMSGFNGPTFASSSAETIAEMPKFLMLPGSGTSDSSQLTEKSNMGIPGEWLSRIDEEQIFLCGAGFQGNECVDSCLPTQWHLDCSRQCHCADGSACNVETGECPNGKCNPGWKGAPICDEDIDECQDESVSCPNEQPDCMNTPGAYLCLCYEYDNSTGKCIGSSGDAADDNAALSMASQQRIPVPIPSMVLTPQLGPPWDKMSHQISTQMPTKVTRPSAPKLLLLGTEKAAPMQHKSEFRIKTAPAFAPPLLHSAGASASHEHPAACSACDANAVCMQNACQCSDGWRGDGKICIDIDECEQNSTICGHFAECQNTIGSYQCLCNVGFIARPDGQGCIDVDECEETISAATTVCPQENTVCTNFVGGFDCQCKSGFSGDPLNGEGCKDINECEMAEHYCGWNANCTNLDGTFRCECYDGFQQVPNSSAGTKCQDINECDDKTVCHHAATCTNVEGSYLCQCVDGFSGNGKECHETILFPIGQKRSVLGIPNKQMDSKVVQLDLPMQIFGQNYSQFYVSSNGYISFNLRFNDTMNFDEMFKNFQFNGGGPVFLPLLAKFVPHSNEFIDIQQIDDQAPQSKGALNRAALQIQQHFRIADFKPQRLVTITWGEMHTVSQPTNTRGGSTFQVVLIDGILPNSSATFATFLYESVQMNGTHFFTGIVHPFDGVMSPIPFEQLTTGSNVGQSGKWVFRCDQTKLYTCPAGTKGAPLCQEDCEPGTFGLNCAGKCRCANGLPCDFSSGFCPDGKCTAGFSGKNCDSDLDECALGTHRCDKNAICSNLIGSYTCTCNENFHGDGFNCSIADICLARIKLKCAANAHCDSTNEELPECVCNDGFYGDGRRKCEQNGISTEITMKTMPTSTASTDAPPTQTTHTVTDSTVSSATTVSLTVFNTTRKAQFVPTRNSGAKSAEKTTTSAKESVETAPKVPNESRKNKLLAEANESKVLVLVVCSAIGAVWLIVAIFFSLIYCVKRYRWWDICGRTFADGHLRTDICGRTFADGHLRTDICGRTFADNS
ncbi:hypothetical protein niasHS_008985 [Heterodera schachtii]|uniref:Uncharacterized protein n=1 Tax=Heterodera schachtii TaxID=97005 RepID=A0ABD2J6G4_HETSC